MRVTVGAKPTWVFILTLLLVAAVRQAPASSLPDEARQTLFGIGVEQVDEVPAQVIGKIPEWLSGTLVVNGGGDYSAGGALRHLFDGFSMLVRYRITGGQVWGSQRYVDSIAYRAYKETGKLQYNEFGTVSEQSRTLKGLVRSTLSALLGRINEIVTDNPCVSVVAVGPVGGALPRKLLALSEVQKATYLINSENLATMKQVLLDDDMSGDALTTAHPAPLSDGSLINVVRSLPSGDFTIYKQDRITLERSRVAKVKARNPLAASWVHSVVATDRHVVLIEAPIYFNLFALLAGTPAEHVVFDWKPKTKTRVTVVPLGDPQLARSFVAPPFMWIHQSNCFEGVDAAGKPMIFVDLCMYTDPSVLNDQLLESMRHGEQGIAECQYSRLSIPLEDPSSTGGGTPLGSIWSSITQAALGLVQQVPFASMAGLPAIQAPIPLLDPALYGSYAEFPHVSPLQERRAYRYGYALSMAPGAPRDAFGNAISKMDVQQGTAVMWHEPGSAPSEPLFVPNPTAGPNAEEDDGVVLTTCMGADGRSYLVVLDGRDLKELARAVLPFGTPYRFHGVWLAEAQAVG